MHCSDHRYMWVGGSFDALARGRTVISFDQRGTSQPGPVTGTPRLIHWAQDIEAVRAAVGAEQVDLLGHSFGGIMAMSYAENYGGRVRPITFVNSTAPTMAATKSVMADVFPDRIETWQQARVALPPRFKASEMRVFTEMEFVDPERNAAYQTAIKNFTYNIEVNNELRVDMAPLDFTQTLQSVKYPVLIIHGRYDPVIAPSVSWNLHQIMPHSKLEIIEGTGHLPFVEKSVVFFQIVEDFLMKIDKK